ncbi:MAG: RNA-binding S4 domain-containing protein [Acidobacteriia bacterium]|nr:RNA-binding S4 domain-containing protein [Terriglobia bacterium]
MRLDLFLKWSGLIRRRTLSKWLCERGAIRVNEQAAKPGRAVSVGDRIAILRGDRRLMVEVLDLPTRVLNPRSDPADPQKSPEWYRVINPS